MQLSGRQQHPINLHIKVTKKTTKAAERSAALVALEALEPLVAPREEEQGARKAQRTLPTSRKQPKRGRRETNPPRERVRLRLPRRRMVPKSPHQNQRRRNPRRSPRLRLPLRLLLLCTTEASPLRA